jgi:hypothetical protein
LPVPVSPVISSGGKRRAAAWRASSCATCSRIATIRWLSPRRAARGRLMWPGAHAFATGGQYLTRDARR